MCKEVSRVSLSKPHIDDKYGAANIGTSVSRLLIPDTFPSIYKTKEAGKAV